MRIETVDGVKRFYFRQSWLNTFLVCPERARALWKGEVQEPPSVEAAIGTATHTAIEQFRGGTPPADALEAATEQFRGLSEAPGFTWTTIKKPETAEQHIVNCFSTWLRDVEPLVGPSLGSEVKFCLPFHSQWKCRGAEWQLVELWLEGCIDDIDPWGLWDWKTGSSLRKYTTDAWQLKRWAIQPTTYTWAVTQLGYDYDEDSRVPFTFAAMERSTTRSAVVCLERGAEHWAFLQRLCWHIVALVETGLGQWPLNDQHALCSDLWCPNWEHCKGAYVQLTDHPTTA